MSSRWIRASKKHSTRASDIVIGGCMVRPSLNLIECARHSTRISPCAMDTLVHLAAPRARSCPEMSSRCRVAGPTVLPARSTARSSSELPGGVQGSRHGESFIQTVSKRRLPSFAPGGLRRPRVREKSSARTGPVAAKLVPRNEARAYADCKSCVGRSSSWPMSLGERPIIWPGVYVAPETLTVKPHSVVISDSPRLVSGAFFFDVLGSSDEDALLPRVSMTRY